MKAKTVIILIQTLVILAFAVLWKRPDPVPAVGQNYIDSLLAAANKPPEIVYKDTVIYKEKVVTVYRDKPIPVYVDSSGTKSYADSLKTDDIDVNVDLQIKGDLLSIQWNYRPITKEIIKEITITRPVPVPYEVEKKVSGLLAAGGVGYGNQKPALSVDIGYITKGGTYWGGEGGYFGDAYFKLKIGRIF